MTLFLSGFFAGIGTLAAVLLCVFWVVGRRVIRDEQDRERAEKRGKLRSV